MVTTPEKVSPSEMHSKEEVLAAIGEVFTTAPLRDGKNTYDAFLEYSALLKQRARELGATDLDLERAALRTLKPRLRKDYYFLIGKGIKFDGIKYFNLQSGDVETLQAEFPILNTKERPY